MRGRPRRSVLASTIFSSECDEKVINRPQAEERPGPGLECLIIGPGSVPN